MKNTLSRRHTLGALATGVLAPTALFGSAAHAADFPSKPIRMITPYSPGGISDKVVRALADELLRTHKWNLIVENRTGANTVPAALGVTTAPPDGHTIGWFAGATFAAIPLLNTVPYKVEQFQPVFMGFKGPLVLVVSNEVPANNITEYLAWVRQQGKPALIGATARGGTGHLLSAALGLDAKITAEVVAYRGGPPIVLALVANQLPAAIDIVDTFLAQHRAKKLRIIGITSEKRLPLLPEVQTFSEAGLPSLTSSFWQGLFAPVGTPAPLVDLLAQRFEEAFAVPNVRAQLSGDLEHVAMKPAEFAQFVAQDRAFWQRIISAANIKMNE